MRTIHQPFIYNYFKGRNCRGFAVFSQIRESLFPRNFSKDVIRESFFPRNFLKKPSSANILKKYTFVVIISKWFTAKVYSREIFHKTSSAKIFRGLPEPRKFLPLKYLVQFSFCVHLSIACSWYGSQLILI